MDSNSGKIYDQDELSRIKGYVSQFEKESEVREKAASFKDWLIAGIIILSTTATILIMLKKKK